MEDEIIRIPRKALGMLMSAAEARYEQYERFSKGKDPYGTDCIYECDQEEAAAIAELYQQALEAYRQAVKSKPT